EVMTSPGSGVVVEVVPGARLEMLVGAHNRARHLMTGTVTFAPSAWVPCHTHTFAESLTPLEGRLAVEVEGRRYELDPLSNIVIPRGIPHRPGNALGDRPTVVHIALANDAPTRGIVENRFEIQPMRDDATGIPGAERVTRLPTAARSEAGPGTSFIDYYNETLLPGIEMSGGYGLFEPGGRLPAHVHDFDESICIIDGEATCIVEGRRRTMSGGATALQPRGRVHYFVNNSGRPMAMLWVYAGPRPERIVVDERCATVAGDPWRDGAPR
ncbi:MAG TPA: cupin domain-containing protein, partial [Isosphaeraceae bacterium]